MQGFDGSTVAIFQIDGLNHDRANFLANCESDICHHFGHGLNHELSFDLVVLKKDAVLKDRRPFLFLTSNQ